MEGSEKDFSAASLAREAWWRARERLPDARADWADDMPDKETATWSCNVQCIDITCNT